MAISSGRGEVGSNSFVLDVLREGAAFRSGPSVELFSSLAMLWFCRPTRGSNRLKGMEREWLIT